MEGIEYHVRTILELNDKQSRAMGRAVAQTRAMSRAAEMAGGSMMSFGSVLRGQGGMALSVVGRMTAAFGALAGVAGIGAAIKSGIDFNIQMESMTMSVASMFQLYNRHQGDFSKNLQDSEVMMQRLYSLAAKAPGEFEDVAQIYQNSATALTVANIDMERQVDFMRKSMMLLATSPEMKAMGGGQIIGSQLGRTLMGGAGEEMELYKKLRPAMLTASKEMFPKDFGKATMADFSKYWNKFAKSSPQDAVAIMEAALEPLDVMASEFENTWDAITGTTMSAMKTIKGAFTKGLFDELKKVMVHLNTKGFFSEDNVRKLSGIAASLGQVLAVGASKMYSAFSMGASWLQKHWKEVANAVYQAFQTGAFLIKVSVARYIAGSIVMAFSKGVSLMGRAKGGIGSMASAMRSRMGPGAGGIAMIGKMTAAFGMLAVGAALALTGIAGLAAFLVENWNVIVRQVLAMFERGDPVLRNLIEAGMKLWAVLVRFGEKLLGITGTADIASSIMKVLTGAIEGVTSVVGLMIMGWGALQGAMFVAKLAMSDFMKVLVGMLKLLNKVPGIDFDVAGMEKMQKSLQQSAEDSAKKGVDYWNMGSNIMDASLKDLGINDSDVDSKVGEWAKSFKSFARGAGGKGGATVPPRSVTNIANQNINMDLRDQDPDRIMALFVDELTDLTDKPTQAKNLIPQGA